MKFISLLLAAFCLTALPVASKDNFMHHKMNANNSETTYEITNFSQLPDGWKLYEKCDTGNTVTSFQNGEMVITNKNTDIAAPNGQFLAVKN